MSEGLAARTVAAANGVAQDAAFGAVIAWFTISSDVLEEEGEEPECDYSCGVGAPVMQPGREPEAPAAVRS